MPIRSAKALSGFHPYSVNQVELGPVERIGRRPAWHRLPPKDRADVRHWRFDGGESAHGLRLRALDVHQGGGIA